MALSAGFRRARYQWFALALLGVLAFLAIAQFTPLHQHSWDGSCSLNGFDDVVLSSAVLPLLLFQLAGFAFLPPVLQGTATLRGAETRVRLRGPPASA